MLVLKGAVITPKEIIKDGIVAVDNGKIVYVGAGLPRPYNGDIIDCRGKFICPGFIDVHVQGAGGCDILDGNYEALNSISRALAANGVTAFLATTVYKTKSKIQSHLDAVRQAIRKGTQGAQVLGVHLEGPFINPLKCGMIKKENICRGGVTPPLQVILDACGGSLKMMTIAPEMPGTIDIIKKLKKNKIVAAIGHTDATYDEAIKGFDAGITHATHVFNAMRSLHHREPGAVGAILTDERVSVQLIADGRHLHPAMVSLVIKQKSPDKTALITDSMSAAGLPDGRYVYNGLKYESKDGLAVYCRRGGPPCPPVAGRPQGVAPTFIGTSLTLNKIVKRIVDMGAVNLQQAVLMASLVPARVLEIEGKKGSLEKGKDADIIVIDKNCDVEKTIIAGKVLK